ncbi:MAG: L-lysine 6-transaminase [Anaerolineales bacterium]|nr:L-lysine 6-transaminase [Anaerolineales bacterium]
MKPSAVHKIISNNMIGDGEPIVVDLKNSHGPYIRDAVTGKEYLDFFTFYASQPIGYNHPKMRSPEFLEKLIEAALVKPSSSDFYTTFLAEFVHTFQDKVMHPSMNHLFLISGGAMAVENALKAAFDWKVRKNIQILRGPSDMADLPLIEGFGGKIIHFEGAFHGRSGYTLSLTNTADPWKYLYYPKFEWPRIPAPGLRFPLTDEVIQDVVEAEKLAIYLIEKAVQKYPGDIAGLIIEPIQSEGGDRHFRPEFFRELRRLADDHEFLLIVDEVQTGMGVTGKMWAVEHLGIVPDVMAFGKKSQVCGVMAGARVDEVEKNVFRESSRINSTFGGNLVDMVRATRYIEIIEEENLLENTTMVGNIMLKGLKTIAERSGGLMTNVRGVGLLLAYDLPNEKTRDEMLSDLRDKGLYAIKCGQNSIRFRGMLDVSTDIVEKALDIVEASVQEIFI